MPVVLDQLSTEIKGYAKDSIKIEFIDFHPYPEYGGTGGKWDVNDIGSCQIKVSNNGKLNVKNLMLHINQKGGYGKIRWDSWGGGTGGWQVHLDVPVNGIIPAGDSRWARGLLCFRADEGTNEKIEDLFEAHVAEYDLSLDSLLYDATTHEWAAQAIQSEEIHGL